jgi:hypothetical protein
MPIHRLLYFLFAVFALCNMANLRAENVGPNTLEEAFVALDQILTPEARAQFRKTPENKAVTSAHFGLGMYIRNEWFRAGQSKLPGLLQATGARHMDDMSAIVLTSYWRHLNSIPLRANEQVECYTNWWKEQTRQTQETKAKGESSYATPSFSCLQN